MTNDTRITARKDRFNSNGDTYCVPFAIAELTGLSYAAVEQLVRDIRGQSPDAPVSGIKRADWMPILMDLVPDAQLFTTERIEYWAKFPRHEEFCALGPTLAKWHRELSPEERNRTILVQVTGHVLLVRGEFFCDNAESHGEWLPLDTHPKRRARVSAYIVMPPEED